jgi:ATP-binding cassette subfamily E protein 1
MHRQRSFIMHSRKSALVIEHDFLLATYLADRVVVFSGKPAIEANASPPQSLLTGMNDFLRSLEVTYRRDPDNYRPRVNKFDSVKDREQKASGRYVSRVHCQSLPSFAEFAMYTVLPGGVIE